MVPGGVGSVSPCGNFREFLRPAVRQQQVMNYKNFERIEGHREGSRSIKLEETTW